MASELLFVISALSVVAGLTLVSREQLWGFPCGIRPYLHGNPAALLYLVALTTTMMAMGQSALILHGSLRWPLVAQFAAAFHLLIIQVVIWRLRKAAV